MVYGVYAFRDNKTAFGQIWCDSSDEAAKRGFSMMINNGDGIMGFAPSDFDLFKIGEFDSDNGQLTPCWPITYLVNGNAVIERRVVPVEKPESESFES